MCDGWKAGWETQDLDEGPYRTMEYGQSSCRANPTLADVLWGLSATQDYPILCWGAGPGEAFCSPGYVAASPASPQASPSHPHPPAVRAA